VEFIIGQQEKILWKHSYPIGVARLIERFHHTDPISDEELITLQSYIVHNIKEVRDALIEFPCGTLIGSAGSFETLLEVLNKDLRIPIEPLSNHAQRVPLDAFQAFYELMLSSNKEQRSKLQGMADFRVEMIVVATILTDVVLKRFELTELIASDYSLKEGVLFSTVA
jgi:exopolyphosphatase / guanosine-5'-triphosphate,3'-diphosphate pyrophosphatase